MRKGSYVLIVDPDVRRAEAYRQLALPHDLDAAIAQDGDDAKAILARRGPPILLLTELSLPRSDGFSVIEALRQQADARASAVLVTSAFASLRRAAEEARDRLGIDGVFVRETSLDVVGAAIRDTLRRVHDVTPVERDLEALHPGVVETPANEPDAELAAFAADSARAFDVPVGAVYLKSGPRELFAAHCELPAPSFRESERWSFMREVVETGERLIVPDAIDHPVFGSHPLVEQGLMRGFACVPLLAQGEVVGALCLIDVKPLTLSAPEFDALATYGGVVGSDVVKLPAQRESPVVPARNRLDAPPGGLHELLVNDPLTGLATRTRVEQEIAREVSRSQRTRTALSCVLIDVDNLDDVVETLGRAIADEILQRITRVLNTSIRGSDLAARWGLEEFLLLLPGVPRDGARTVAERVRVRVQQLRSTPRITVSAGVVELSAHRTVEEALAEADERLSKAKKEGRNRVV